MPSRCVSRRLARVMGGDLVLDPTTVDAGRRFLLTMPADAVADPVGVPLAAAPAPATSAIVAPAPAAAPPPVAPPEPWRPKILVCDDSPDIRQLLGVVLERAGAEAALAPSGEVALVLAGGRRPDVVLLDLDLPGMNGIEVATALRTRGYDGPVIAVTGGGEELTPAALREHGFTDIVHKPTPGSVLVDVVSAHLPAWTPRRHRSARAR